MVLRRASNIDAMLPRSQRMVTKYYDICERGFEHFMNMVCDEICEVMFMDYFYDVEEDSQEYIDIVTSIYNYVESKHTDDIKNYYKSWCGMHKNNNSKPPQK